MTLIFKKILCKPEARFLQVQMDSRVHNLVEFCRKPSHHSVEKSKKKGKVKKKVEEEESSIKR